MPSLSLSDNTSDSIACGSDASIDDFSNLTLCMWVYPTLNAATQFFASKENLSVGFEKEFTQRPSGVISTFVKGVTTHSNARSATSQITLNTWNFIAFWHDSGQNSKIYHGNLSTPPTEVSYSQGPNQGTGGIVADAAGSFVIGANGEATPIASQEGRYGPVTYANAAWNLGQITTFWKNPGMYYSSQKGLWFPGLHGLTSVPDLSGNGNAGTGVGTVQEVGPPLSRPFEFPLRTVSYGAAAPPVGFAFSQAVIIG